MKRLLTLFLVASFCLLQGCGPKSDSQKSATDSSKSTEKSDSHAQTPPDNHEILIGEICTHVAKLYAVVENTKDTASAALIAEEVSTFQAEGKSLTDRLEALPDAPEAEAKQLQEKYGDKLAELTRQIEEIKKVGRKYPALGKALQGAVPIF